MINHIRVTEFQLEAHAKSGEDDQQASQPAAENEGSADPAVHENGVVQGFADAHVAVIRHGCRGENSAAAKRTIKNNWVAQAL